MTEFLAILAIAVGLAVVAYIKVPKFKLFIDNKFLKNFKDSFNSASEASEVEAGTPLPTPSEKSPVEAVKPLIVDFYDGQGDPPSQEAWAAWRARQPKSTQAYIPKVWTPTELPALEDPSFNMPKPFPTHWDYSRKRVPVLLKAGKVYTMAFEHDGKSHQMITTSNVNIKGQKPIIVFRNSKGSFPIPTRSINCNIQVGPGTNYETTEGTNYLDFSVEKDGGWTFLLNH